MVNEKIESIKKTLPKDVELIARNFTRPNFEILEQFIMNTENQAFLKMGLEMVFTKNGLEVAILKTKYLTAMA